MTVNSRFVVWMWPLLALAGLLSCTPAREMRAVSVAATPATALATTDQTATAAAKIIEVALSTTHTAAPPPPLDLNATATAAEQQRATALAATVAAQPTATSTPDAAATQTAETQRLATMLAETLTAAPTNTPTATPTPNLDATATASAERMATAVAETLTAQPSPTPNAIETQNARQRAIELTLTAQPTPIPPPTQANTDDLRIVFAYGDVGNSDLRVIDVETRAIRTLAGQRCDEAEPAWSPDGFYVVYHANCAESYDIYRVDSANGATERLTTTRDIDEREPDYAPDGSQLVYRVNPHDATKTNDIGDLWTMDANGNNQRALGVTGRAPAWSPDGGRIAYMDNLAGVWNIYVYDLGTQRSTQVTHCATNCRWPGWSPDGQILIYNTTTKANNTIADALWIVSPTGGNETRLAAGGNIGRPSWSRTGLIAFNSTIGIEVMQADGAGRAVLIPDNANWAPYWSR